MGIEVLEKKGAMRILMELRDAPKPITQLMKDLGIGQDRIYTSVEDFKANGIVEDNKMTTFPYSRTINLTNKGIRLADLVHQVDEVITDYDQDLKKKGGLLKKPFPFP